MSLRPLVIGETERRRAAEIVAYARDHIYRPGPDARPPGLDPGLVAHFQLGFRIVFSFTELKGRLHRHLTVSVTPMGVREALPHPAAVELIGQLFGFTGPIVTWRTGVHPVESCVVAAQITEGEDAASTAVAVERIDA